MYCLKCGKETKENRVFCDGCIGNMSDYPVKVDAKVSLPNREQAVLPKKQPRKRTLEEQLLAMQRLSQRLVIALVAVTIMLVVSVTALMFTYSESEALPTIGRNYTIDTSMND